MKIKYLASALLLMSSSIPALQVESNVEVKYHVKSDLAIIRGKITAEAKEFTASEALLRKKLNDFKAVLLEGGIRDSQILLRIVNTDGLKGFFSGKNTAVRQVATMEIRVTGEASMIDFGNALKKFGAEFELGEIQYECSKMDSINQAVDSLLIRKALAKQAAISQVIGTPCTISTIQTHPTYERFSGFSDNPMARYTSFSQDGAFTSNAFIMPEEIRSSSANFTCKQ